MSLLGYDLERVGAPIKGVKHAMEEFTEAYRQRTDVEKLKVEMAGLQVEALNRLAEAVAASNQPKGPRDI